MMFGQSNRRETSEDTDTVKTSEEKTADGKGAWDIAIRLLLTLGLLCGIYMVGTRAIAHWYSRQAPQANLYKAIAWDPGNAKYYSALGRTLQQSLQEVDSEEIIQLFQKATQLNPQNARYWVELAGAYEWTGRDEDALLAFEQARGLFPNSPRINWWLGNYYLRDGKLVKALEAFHKVLLGDPTLRDQVFNLAWRATENNHLIIEKMIPPTTEIIFPYLDYLSATGHIDEAQQLWTHLQALDLPYEPQAVFPFLDALIRHERVDELVSAWSIIMEKSTTAFQRIVTDNNLVRNGYFETKILNGGLDWRVKPMGGIVVRVDNLTFFDGTHSLSITFKGEQNTHYYHISQLVPVKPNTLYHFQAYVRSQEISTDSGPRFEISDAYDNKELFLRADNILGTSSWKAQQHEFRTGPKTRLLVIRLTRLPSLKLDNKISGTLWIDRVRLFVIG